MRYALWALALWTAAAQNGTRPKDKPTDYPAHTTSDQVVLGAEYLVHSVPGAGETYFVPNYLVVEVACFPAKGARPNLQAGQFTLRINGKRDVVFPQAPSFVAASLKYPDWERRPRLVGEAGPVIIGRPERVERFPGDPRPGRTRLPEPPRAPDTGSPREPAMSAEELVVDAALPEGEAAGPVSGYLYFAYRGKTKKIKSLELLWSGGEEPVVLELLPAPSPAPGR
jgi:hypothetical protein